MDRTFSQERKPSTYFIAQWLFLKMVAISYLAAFLSLYTQISGLIGKRGILPVQEYLPLVYEKAGSLGYWFIPSVFWFNSSDAALHFVCAIGTVLATLVLFGVAPAPLLLILWGLYLSLCSVCRDFLGFQWDILLLETGFLAAFLVSPTIFRHRLRTPPVKAVLWLLWWLLFRLMFSSGMVKILSGDPTWRDLTAMTFHYETQPLPTWIGWYAHQLPVWFQKATTFLVLAIEIVAPFLVWIPGRVRKFAAFFLIGLQLLIALTGNYCFFNLLTIALCILLIEDAAWPRKWQELTLSETTLPIPAWQKVIAYPVCVLILLLSCLQLSITLGVRSLPSPILTVYRWSQPLCLVNRYGLFAVMTTSRKEIVIEGSNDQNTWLAYEFPYKPGDLKRHPEFIAPFQPRLDWQMWFAALETYQSNEWFIPFCFRLLEGSPDVLKLMKLNPFPDHPPRYIRAVIYDYHFTTFREHAEQGTWWKKGEAEEYCPVVSNQ